MHHGSWDLKSVKKAAAPLCGAALLTALFLTLLPLLLYFSMKLDLRLYQERSPLLYDRAGNIISYELSDDGRLRFYSPPESVDPLYLKLILAAEDERFYEHPGVDLIAAARALLGNTLALRRVSGASTIDMQCIRLLEKNPRTWRHKFLEAIQAVKLRRQLGPQGVLTLYLTLCPFGSRLEGVHAAALAWFGHDARHLSPAEAALLAALPRAPELLRPDRHPARAWEFRRRVLQRALELGFIDEKSAAAALDEPLPGLIRPIARPGFYAGRHLFPRMRPEREVYSSLDPQVQHILMAKAAEFNLQHSGEDDLDLAVVVIDDRTHEVKGYLGGRSPDLNELDLTHALRSPGSALKPFAYALAMDRHLLHPGTLIEDDSQSFTAWQPLNFNRSYSGLVTAEEALLRSLNVPAVKVLQRLTPELFYAFLNQGSEKHPQGPRVILPRGAAPSLPLILGGAGIRLFDLTTLYSMLNTDGRLYEATMLQADRRQEPAAGTGGGCADARGLPMLSQSAAVSVRGILRRSPPPWQAGAAAWQQIAYKTGTSSNFTDALALGSCGPYTVGVWAGRRSGRSNYPATGRSLAAPLLSEIFAALGQSFDLPQSSRLQQEKAQLSSAPPAFLRFFDPEKGRSAILNSGDNTRAGAYGRAGPRHQAGTSLLDPMLQFIFPSDGSVLLCRSGDEIMVEAAGGTAPYLLLVNGLLQPELSFRPPMVPGFYELTLLDQKGHSAVITVRLSDGRDLR